MSGYIKRDTAIRAVMATKWVDGSDGAMAMEIVASLPAADVVPVVHCRDCKHYDMGVCLKIYSDGNVHSAAWQSRNPDDYCSYGDRKD